MIKGGVNMVKVQVIEDFSLFSKFNELKNLKRNNYSRNKEGYLYINDTFECTEDIAEYLINTNAKGKAFVKIIEVIPEEKPKTEKKTTTRKTTRKTIAKK